MAATAMSEAFRNAIVKEANRPRIMPNEEDDYWTQVVFFVANTPEIPKILITYDYWWHCTTGIPHEWMEQFPHFKAGMVFIAEDDFYRLIEFKKTLGINMEVLSLIPRKDLRNVREAQVIMLDDGGMKHDAARMLVEARQAMAT